MAKSVQPVPTSLSLFCSSHFQSGFHTENAYKPHLILILGVAHELNLAGYAKKQLHLSQFQRAFKQKVESILGYRFMHAQSTKGSLKLLTSSEQSQLPFLE